MCIPTSFCAAGRPAFFIELGWGSEPWQDQGLSPRAKEKEARACARAPLGSSASTFVP